MYLVVTILVAISIIYLLVHPVSNEYMDKNRRGGSLWLVVSKLPMVFSSSVMFWFLFPVGLIGLYLMMQHLVYQGNYLLLISFPLFLIVCMMSQRTYQRYYEPFLLFFIGYSVATMNDEQLYDWLGPSVLLVGFLGVALIQFYF